ncbi:hypothetical protein [uncultured Pseudomonas sp.]|uniref:hypothetical protein n=1 Tax=uncultured Pseudomonas sp. TaxID=114707 RepID=UPI0025D04185|nr:hypothetical protein [uncultured Pseudomonas sp.]
MKTACSTALALVIGLGLIAGGPAHASTDAQVTAKTQAFDVSQLPVSTVSLGAFPYIALPDGYTTGSTPEVSEFDQIPFWTGDRLEPVEGRVWSANITNSEGKTFSDFELARNVEAVVKALGGQKIFDGTLTRETTDALQNWPRHFAEKYNSGLGDVWNNPAHVFVIHREDRDIWVHLCAYAFGAGLLIVESKPLAITARPQPATP